jgi:hypothetical protein
MTGQTLLLLNVLMLLIGEHCILREEHLGGDQQQLLQSFAKGASASAFAARCLQLAACGARRVCKQRECSWLLWWL